MGFMLCLLRAFSPIPHHVSSIVYMSFHFIRVLSRVFIEQMWPFFGNCCASGE